MTNDESLLIDAHILMLGDPDFQKKIDDYLSTNLVNAEAAVFETVKEFIADLSLSNNAYAKERISDFRDVARRVLGKLTSRCLRNLSSLDEECIVVSRDILPSDAIVMDKSKVRGIVLEAGGRTSHTAIIARAFGIPAVESITDSDKKSGDSVEYTSKEACDTLADILEKLRDLIDEPFPRCQSIIIEIH